MDESTRREFFALAGGATALAVTLRPAEATPAMLASAIRNVTGGATVKTGKVKLDVWTHNIGGLSENDFILAAKVEAAK